MIIAMHESTFHLLKEKIESANRLQVPVHYSGLNMVFGGDQVIINNYLKPTINEGTSWIFPREKFVSYEKKDEEWCRYFGFGRQGQGLIIGDIIHQEQRSNNYITDLLLDRVNNKKQKTVMTDLGPISSWY